MSPLKDRVTCRAGGCAAACVPVRPDGLALALTLAVGAWLEQAAATRAATRATTSAPTTPAGRPVGRDRRLAALLTRLMVSCPGGFGAPIRHCHDSCLR